MEARATAAQTVVAPCLQQCPEPLHKKRLRVAARSTVNPGSKATDASPQYTSHKMQKGGGSPAVIKTVRLSVSLTVPALSPFRPFTFLWLSLPGDPRHNVLVRFSVE